MAPKVDETEQNKLKMAARKGDIDTLYSLLGGDGMILDKFDGKGLCETPLHVAAEEGQIQFALEVINLKPSFAARPNESGYTPMDLALHNKHFRMVKALVAMDSELISIKGRGGITPLHYVAAEPEHVHLLSEFLSACPSSVQALTTKCETAVHIAVKKRNFEAFRVLLGWLRRVNQDEILNWKDEHGNTALHIATSTKQTEVVKLLRKVVNVNAKNFAGKTAMDICKEDPDEKVKEVLRGAKAKTGEELKDPKLTLAGYLSRSLSLLELRNKLLGLSNFNDHRKGSKSANDSQGAVLVVAVLIATATYQAGLSPPGGFWQDDSDPEKDDTTGHVAGQMTLNYNPALFFYGFNGVAFFTSMGVIMFNIIGLPTWTVLCGSILALGISNLASFAYTFPSSDEIDSKQQDVGSFLLESAYPIVTTLIATLPLVAFLVHDFHRRRVDTLKGGISARLWG